MRALIQVLAVPLMTQKHYYLGRQFKMVQVLMETWMELLAPRFSLAQPQLLWLFRGVNQ